MEHFQSGNQPSNDEIQAALMDFGLYHPIIDAQRMYSEYVNNNKYWYPGAGIDQPDEFWRDIATMRWLSLYIEHVLPQAHLQSKVSKEDVIARLKRGGNLNG